MEVQGWGQTLLPWSSTHLGVFAYIPKGRWAYRWLHLQTRPSPWSSPTALPVRGLWNVSQRRWPQQSIAMKRAEQGHWRTKCKHVFFKQNHWKASCGTTKHLSKKPYKKNQVAEAHLLKSVIPNCVATACALGALASALVIDSWALPSQLVMAEGETPMAEIQPTNKTKQNKQPFYSQCL